MKHIALLSAIFLFSSTAFADDSYRKSGFWLGAGGAATATDDCGSECETSGHVIELGYDINQALGVELKLGDTSFEYGDGDFEFRFIGLNAGGDFGTGWVKLYGKIGMADVTVSEPGLYDLSDDSVAFGLGVRFTPMGEQKGFYIKLESMRSKFVDLDYAAGFFTLGFKI